MNECSCLGNTQMSLQVHIIWNESHGIKAEMANLFDFCVVWQRGNILHWNLPSVHHARDVWQKLALVFAVNQDHQDRVVAVRDPKPFKRLWDLYEGRRSNVIIQEMGIENEVGFWLLTLLVGDRLKIISEYKLLVFIFPVFCKLTALLAATSTWKGLTSCKWQRETNGEWSPTVFLYTCYFPFCLKAISSCRDRA